MTKPAPPPIRATVADELTVTVQHQLHGVALSVAGVRLLLDEPEALELLSQLVRAVGRVRARHNACD